MAEEKEILFSKDIDTENLSYEKEVYEAYAYIHNHKEIDEEVVDNADEAYNGEFGSDEEFVQELLEDTGDIPKDLPPYIHIDWEGTARDIMMDYSEHEGHYFRNL